MDGSGAVEVDVLVAGAGAAGMTAALVCAVEGLSVLLIEKSSQIGGTSATSAGTLWIPGTTQAREAGHADTLDEARKYLNAIIGPAGDGRREAYLQTGPALIDYLARHSEVKFSLYANHPDYLSNRPGTTLAGRALAPLPFDGRLLGRDFALVRPPIGEFMALGGMTIGRDDIEPLVRPFASAANFRRALAMLWRHVTDRLRHKRGTRLLMGNALVARLFISLRQRNVPIWLDASLQELNTANGRVTGATVTVDGKPKRIVARRGVVLATGGVGGSVEELNKFVQPRLNHVVAFAGAEGDGMRLARSVGGAVEDDHAQPAFWTPVSETAWLRGGRGAYPHLALDRAKPGLIAVNAAGRRFVDEAVSYHEFVVGMHRSHETVPHLRSQLHRDVWAWPRAARLAKLAVLRRGRLPGRGRHAGRTGEADRRGCVRPASERARQQPRRRNRHRRGIRQGLDRLRPPQWGSGPCAQPVSRTNCSAAVLRDGCVPEHARFERRPSRGFGWPRDR
jgi:glycine/D-amino acid oxidase-like deaminating enzyme